MGRWAYRVMQVIMIGIAVYGLLSSRIGIVVNAGIALLITFLPAYLRRDLNIRLGTGITLWITMAVLLHAVGAIGLYKTIWGYDEVTHVLSASIIAGTGYAVVRAIDEHTDDIHLPSAFMFLFIVIFVMAAGVVWELLEYGGGWLSKQLGGTEVVTQYGIDDAVTDLVFDLVGGIIFGIWGTRRVQSVVTSIRRRITG